MTNARRSRIQRKAARVEKTELDREFDREFGALFAEQQKAYRQAALDLDDAVKAARTESRKAKQKADEAFQAGRAKLLERLAKKERAAA